VTGAIGGTTVFGPIMVDHYVAGGAALAGGGALNVCVHLRRAGLRPNLVSRVGNDADGVLLREFLTRHDIAHDAAAIVRDGSTSSIDVAIDANEQPVMENFVEGVWHDFVLTPDEQREIAASRHVHAVMVGRVATELDRIGSLGLLRNPVVSADFLSFRRYSLERFAEAMRHIDIAFIGWPGEPDDPIVTAISAVAFDAGRLVILTMGGRPVVVFDGRERPATHVMPVQSQKVLGTSVGCGDAFIAAFLAGWQALPTLDHAVRAGAAAGAQATTWLGALPDDAYRPTNR
jgi:sugar/nucleoside kinase (ribokinase family)